jgi:hypothetical protein
MDSKHYGELKSSRLLPTQMLCSGLAQLGRVVQETASQVGSQAAGSPMFQGGLCVSVYLFYHFKC